MMRSLVVGTLTACLALAAAGCSRSPRVSYYTLEPAARLEAAPAAAASPAPGKGTGGMAGARAAAGAGTAGAGVLAASAGGPPAPAAPPTLAVGPVTLPELVDRPQLVVRVAANRVAILESQRWAEPLKSEIPRVVAEDLGRLLGPGRVSSYLQHAAAAPDCRVLLDIERFEAFPGDAVSVEAVWSLRRVSGGGSRTGRTQVREPVRGEGYDALVAAYSRALLAVSADLAAAIRGEGGAGGQ